MLPHPLLPKKSAASGAKPSAKGSQQNEPSEKHQANQRYGNVENSLTANLCSGHSSIVAYPGPDRDSD